MTNEKISEIKELIATHEKYSRSYFWKPASNAGGRRSNEFEREGKIEHNGDVYTYYQEYKESCKNCYFSKTYTKNGESKDIRVFKSLLNNLSQ